MTGAAPLLRVEGVSKSFRGLLALNDVSFDVAEREIAALIGPNGAGKTTLFNVIAGVFPPDSGAVRLDGADVTGRRPDEICHAGIGRTFQLVKPFAQMTVLENVTVAALHGARSVAAARTAARGFLELLELDTRAGQHAANLTLPDRKRLEVARALATETPPPAARRGDGRAEAVGDRPHGRDAPPAAGRHGAHDPADRTCDARRHGALGAHRRSSTMGRRSARARRTGSCAIRRCSNAISGTWNCDPERRRPEPVLRRRPGARRRIAGGRRRRHRRGGRFQRRRQELPDPHHRGHAEAALGQDRLQGRGHRGLAQPPGLQPRYRPGRRRPPDIRRAHGAREPGGRRLSRTGKTGQRGDHGTGLRDVSDPAGTGRTAGRHAFGRRAADAGDRPLPAGPAGAHHVRRTVARALRRRSSRRCSASSNA